MNRPLAIVLLSFGFLQVSPGQPGTPGGVFVEVNRDLNDYKSLEYAYEPKDGEEPFEVKAWLSKGVFRRIKASQKGDGGVLTRDFYYDAEGGLKFALASLSSDAKDGKPAALVEERFDFADGALVRYLGPDKKPVLKEDKNFAEMETGLVAMSEDLVERIEGSTAYAGMIGADAPKAAVGTVFGAGYSDGTFSGTEQGDYLHLDLEQADGGIETFFVIKPDASVELLLKDAGASKGAKIRVHWTEKMQDIPETGEAARMKICDRIELLK